MSASPPGGAGAVAIGRNEGDRLHRCLESLIGQADPVVYVDSGSTDDSVSFAQSLGVEVVELDMSIPFTAARARNAGVERLRELAPDIPYVHFFDGDVEVVPGWIALAVETIEGKENVAVVWGRRRERYPERSVYNKLTDLEWKYNWPYGEVKLCGGDALMRLDAFTAAGGFDPTLIAGEEPELCLRLREAGWTIYRLDADMALHDAAMTRFSQWWRRSLRGGYADAERNWRYHGNPTQHWRKSVRSAWVWGLGVPVVAIAAGLFTNGWGLLLFGAYGVNLYRSRQHLLRCGAGKKEAALYAAFATLSKFPGALGQLKFHVGRLMGRGSTLIEYK